MNFPDIRGLIIALVIGCVLMVVFSWWVSLWIAIPLTTLLVGAVLYGWLSGIQR